MREDGSRAAGRHAKARGACSPTHECRLTCSQQNQKQANCAGKKALAWGAQIPVQATGGEALRGRLRAAVGVYAALCSACTPHAQGRPAGCECVRCRARQVDWRASAVGRRGGCSTGAHPKGRRTISQAARGWQVRCRNDKTSARKSYVKARLAKGGQQGTLLRSGRRRGVAALTDRGAAVGLAPSQKSATSFNGPTLPAEHSQYHAKAWMQNPRAHAEFGLVVRAGANAHTHPSLPMSTMQKKTATQESDQMLSRC